MERAGAAFKTHDGKVARPAAEIAHHHGGVALELAGEEKGRRHRLVGVAHFAEAQTTKGRLITVQREGGIGPQA